MRVGLPLTYRGPAGTLPGMSTPAADFDRRLSDVERRTRQHRDDVDAVYGLIEGLDRKVTDLDRRVTEGFERMDQGFAAILTELRDRK